MVSFPAALVSRVVPLHKKGDPNNLTNYRPMSIVPIMGKIIEKILFEQLYEYSETKYILSPFQFGFRQGRCTTSAIQELVSRVVALKTRNMWVVHSAIYRKRSIAFHPAS
jgi:hypothetical protein